MAYHEPSEENHHHEPRHIAISDPWVSRHGTSSLLNQSDGPAGSDLIQTTDQETYGNPNHPIRFRIGNGGAGYTGILRVLCSSYLETNGHDFRIGWVSNHSRHSQIALLADVVQVALTYEPENEDIAVEEGWAVRTGRAFNDHFVLVGPDVGVEGGSVEAALRNIAGGKMLFHTRGDGSATFGREQLLWKAAGVELRDADWMKTYPSTPYEALVRAQREQAFLLTDRATFLTAKQDGKIPSLRVHVEGGKQLLNPCSALVVAEGFRRDGSSDEGRRAAADFTTWLSGSKAQDLVRSYGKDWALGKALFTVAGQDDFDEDDRLSSQ